MLDSTLEEMRKHLVKAACELRSAFAVAYPAAGNNAAAERNMTTYLAHQLLAAECWNVWTEFNFDESRERGDRRHLDCVALAKDENALWCIEAKRLYCSEGAGAILDDIDRIEHFHPGRLSGKKIAARYGLVIASAWGDVGPWWKDGSGKFPGRSPSWTQLEKFLSAKAPLRDCSELWDNERDHERDPRVELQREYFCWAGWKL